jgi:hypothetical protein
MKSQIKPRVLGWVSRPGVRAETNAVKAGKTKMAILNPFWTTQTLPMPGSSPTG